MWIDLDDFLCIAEYARHIGKTTTWVHKLIREKKLPYILFNGKKLIPKSGVLPEYVNNNSNNNNYGRS